jgi:hypothetical protein
LALRLPNTGFEPWTTLERIGKHRSFADLNRDLCTNPHVGLAENSMVVNVEE